MMREAPSHCGNHAITQSHNQAIGQLNNQTINHSKQSSTQALKHSSNQAIAPLFGAPARRAPRWRARRAFPRWRRCQSRERASGASSPPGSRAPRRGR
eukprot:1537243-Prymnesium_polylepis.1